MTSSSRAVVGRFAPSPTGPLHWGSALAAVGSWLHARHQGGRWLLRIEDLDPPRERSGAAESQLRTLGRLGLHPDAPVLWQSQRHPQYREALERLLAGGLAFPCHCRRSSLAASQGGIHRACPEPDGRAQGRPAYRFRVDDLPIGFEDARHGWFEQRLRSAVGDVLLRRADGLWAYQLAVVVDDAAQGVTEVVRGADLLDSTPRQIALQRALGLPTPNYLHLPLLLDAQGHKLSKSSGAMALHEGRPLEVLRRCWAWLGQPPDAWQDLSSPEAALAQAAGVFDPRRIPIQPRTLQDCDPAHATGVPKAV